MDQSSASIVAEAPAINSQREQDIELLKAIRLVTLDIRADLQRYDTSLAYAFAEPLQKVEEALAWLLLARELES